jgi:hypothetical protein
MNKSDRIGLIDKRGREGEGRAWKQRHCVWRWAVYAAACRMERGRGRGNTESASRSREAGSTSDDDDGEGGKRRDEMNTFIIVGPQTTAESIFTNTIS